jgi:hypothetical protein
MPPKYSIYGQSSSRIYKNGKELESKDTLISSDGRRAKVVARDKNIVKFAELNKNDVKKLLGHRANKKSLIQNLENLLPKKKKRTRKKRKKGNRKTKKRKGSKSWF